MRNKNLQKAWFEGTEVWACRKGGEMFYDFKEVISSKGLDPDKYSYALSQIPFAMRTTIRVYGNPKEKGYWDSFRSCVTQKAFVLFFKYINKPPTPIKIRTMRFRESIEHWVEGHYKDMETVPLGLSKAYGVRDSEGVLWIQLSTIHRALGVKISVRRVVRTGDERLGRVFLKFKGSRVTYNANFRGGLAVSEQHLPYYLGLIAKFEEEG